MVDITDMEGVAELVRQGKVGVKKCHDITRKGCGADFDHGFKVYKIFLKDGTDFVVSVDFSKEYDRKLLEIFKEAVKK